MSCFLSAKPIKTSLTLSVLKFIIALLDIRDDRLTTQLIEFDFFGFVWRTIEGEAKRRALIYSSALRVIS